MDWHRHFGLLLTDLFTGSPFVVELEKDLSLKQQFLDIAIVRRLPGPCNIRLPDGMDNLAPHNLITFKSHHEALDAWPIKELIGHSVNYRKQVSPSLTQLLPETDFRLYAVCARFPSNLAEQVPWQELQPGVYECRWGTDLIRVLVLSRLPASAANAALHLFSFVPALVQYGQAHYQVRSPDTSTLLYRLLDAYRQEGLLMPYTMEDFRRDFRKQFLDELTPEERKQILHRLPPEERLEGLAPDEILKLREEIERYLKRQKNGSSPGPAGVG
jgi:hypothetical protein